MTSIAVKKKSTQPAPAVAETPSAQLIAKADAARTITLPDGRTVTLKKPGVLSQFRLVRMLGDAAKNQVYVSMVTPFTHITAIDGKPFTQPNTEREIDALILRLGDDGVEAVMTSVIESYGDANPAADKAELKN